MRRLLMILAVVIAAAGCSRSADDTTAKSSPSAGVRRYSAAEASEMVARGEAILVDVRERDEIGPGIAEPAYWMPLSGEGGYTWTELSDSLGSDQMALFYCRSGRRSGNIATVLASQGVKTGNAGGYDEWVKAGLPTRKPSPRDRF